MLKKKKMKTCTKDTTFTEIKLLSATAAAAADLFPLASKGKILPFTFLFSFLIVHFPLPVVSLLSHHYHHHHHHHHGRKHSVSQLPGCLPAAAQNHHKIKGKSGKMLGKKKEKICDVPTIVVQ